jgi:hypothetical protein|tara:strand:- start:799 stop:1173 length:375 start_codon:yes stop_codon:yes gene_type:complete
MKKLKNEDLKELSKEVYNIVNRTSIELGRKTDAETMVALSKIFAKDLITHRRWYNLSINQVDTAFYLGVREDEKGAFKGIDIPTFFRWLRTHKKRINEAISQVEYLNKDPKQVEYYPHNQKLLK